MAAVRAPNPLRRSAGDLSLYFAIAFLRS